jgi:hypothetical protein
VVNEPARPIVPPGSTEPIGLADNPRRKQSNLNRRLEAIVRDNQKEYDALSMFQRPIVKRMFQQGTSLKVEEWIASAEQMTRHWRVARRLMRTC